MSADLPGLRIRLEYFDHNERFAGCLPRTATVVRRLTSTGGMMNWLLVTLDEPVQYELRGDASARGRLIETRHLLIRSRWRGHEVGEPEPTSVFILLVEDSALPLAEPLAVERFVHVAWGMAHTLGLIPAEESTPRVPGD